MVSHQSGSSTWDGEGLRSAGMTESERKGAELLSKARGAVGWRGKKKIHAIDSDQLLDQVIHTFLKP